MLARNKPQHKTAMQNKCTHFWRRMLSRPVLTSDTQEGTGHPVIPPQSKTEFPSCWSPGYCRYLAPFFPGTSLCRWGIHVPSWVGVNPGLASLWKETTQPENSMAFPSAEGCCAAVGKPRSIAHPILLSPFFPEFLWVDPSNKFPFSKLCFRASFQETQPT